MDADAPRRWLIAARTVPRGGNAGNGTGRLVVVPRTPDPRQLHDRSWAGEGATPRGTDLWVIPRDKWSLLRTCGSTAEICEIVLPERLFNRQSDRVRVMPCPPLAMQLARRLQRACEADDDRFRESAVETLRLYLIDRLAEDRGQNPRARDVLSESDQAKLMALINRDGPAVDTSVAALARHLGMSKREFNLAITATFGNTPYQFVMDCRVARAKSLLVDTRLPITEVAALVGFSTPSHLSATFRCRLGISPSQYRTGT